MTVFPGICIITQENEWNQMRTIAIRLHSILICYACIFYLPAGDKGALEEENSFNTLKIVSTLPKVKSKAGEP